MDYDELEKLALKKKLSQDELIKMLNELKAEGAGILECIRFVWLNQGISLGEAKMLVSNSEAWIEKKEEDT